MREADLTLELRHAIAGFGFATTYLGIAASMTFATLLLGWSVRQATAPRRAPVATPS